MNSFKLAWIIWLLIWVAISFWSKRTRRHEPLLSRAMHMLPLIIAAYLLAMPNAAGLLGEPVMPRLVWFHSAGLVLTWGGLAFSVWARLYLGSNWSASVQVKQDHELVRSGPYRYVRHPIYTGMLTGFLGCALALDQWRGLLALAIVLAGFIYKLRLEERWMLETFGEAYADYRRHSHALIPFVL
ncbi:MAG: isoprenylcysteine carboxylmethyltransferase family protein [Rhodanobacteraceae bacterium]